MNEAHDLALKLLDVQDVVKGVFEVIAWFFIDTRDAPHAESAISRFEAAGGPQHEALALRGHLHARAGRIEEAERCLRQSISERHDDTVLDELVECLVGQGKWQDVVDLTEKNNLPHKSVVYRSIALIPLGRWQESLARLKDPPDQKAMTGGVHGLIAMNLIGHAKAGHVQEAYDVLTTTWMGERFEPIRHALARRLNRDTEALPAEMESAVAVIDNTINSNDADAFAALIDMFPDRPVAPSPTPLPPPPRPDI